MALTAGAGSVFGTYVTPAPMLQPTGLGHLATIIYIHMFLGYALLNTMGLTVLLSRHACAVKHPVGENSGRGWPVKVSKNN